jgi:hypothetical protein
MKLKVHVNKILKYFIKDNTTTQHTVQFNKQIINVDDTINKCMNHLTQINDIFEQYFIQYKNT